MKTFAIRIDLESQKGISKGLPKLLNLMKDFGVKGSFYLTMGGEASLFDLIKYRGKLKTSGERKIKVFSLLEKIRMVLVPKDFVKENQKILKRILGEEHELGVHGWKHREWTRGLDKINIKSRVDKAIKKYELIFGKKPKSFCAPGFNTNGKVLEILDSQGIKVVSDFPGDIPTKIKNTNITNVPITITGENRTPIIEYLFSQGKSDSEILDYLKEEIEKKDLAVIYIHGMFEGVEKIDLLRKLFEHLREKKIKVETIKDLSRE